jgi:hypothetical protein
MEKSKRPKDWWKYVIGIAGVLVPLIGVLLTHWKNNAGETQVVTVNIKPPTPTTTELPPPPSTDTNKPSGESIGKSTTDYESFSVNERYHPSGKMGDIGDITVNRGVNIDQFIYNVGGRGPHEWDYKYVHGAINNSAAQFAGVMYLDPPNNWGWDPCGGYDLRGFRRITWEARSIGGEVLIEFLVGGVKWEWNGTRMGKVNVSYPDSLPRTSLGTKSLTENWQFFEHTFSEQSLDYFKRVVGGFGWVINWGSNNILPNDEGTAPVQPRTLRIEIRNVRYER